MRRARSIWAVLAAILLAVPVLAVEKTSTPTVAPTLQPTAAITPDAKPDFEAEEYVVQGKQAGKTATKLDIPLAEVPASVVVVNSDTLLNQNANDWVSAMRNVAGAMPYRTYGGFTQSVMRGLARNDLLYLFDGVRDAATAAAGSSSPQANNSMENIDRVEVMKGPSALLYGQGAVAGVINSIRKKPSLQEAYEFGVTLGQFARYRSYFGAQGGLLGSPLSYRLDFGMDDNTGFRGARESRSLASLALATPLWEGANLQFFSTYEKDRYLLDAGIPIDIQTGMLRWGTPLDKRYNTINDFQTRENGQLLLELTQKFGEWELANRASYMPNQDVYLNAETLTLQTYPSTVVKRGYLYFDTRRWPWMDNLELTGKADLLGEHQLLLGYEYQYYLQHGYGHQTGFGSGLPAATDIDLMNPVDTSTSLGPISPNRRTVTTNSGQAGYLQDYWTLQPWVKLLAGLRYDDWRRSQYLQKLDQAHGSEAVLDTYSTTIAATAAPVYKAGVVFGPFDGLTAFMSQSSSYFPNFKTDSADGRISFDPETGTMLEGGLKFETAGGQFQANLSVYDITKHNIMDNPAPVGGLRSYHSAGTLRSTGAEADLTWQPEPLTVLQAGYAYTDAKYVSFVTGAVDPGGRSTDFTGNRPAFIPVNSATLWASKQSRSGLGVGFGGRYTSEVFTNDNNWARMAGYVILNGEIFYAREHDRIQVNIDNLLDKRDYFVSSIRTFQLYSGEPRVLSVRYSRKF